jgi:transketolase
MNQSHSTQHLRKIAQLLRHLILTATSQAGSGHPTSSLSAVELMTILFFSGYFHQDLDNPQYLLNDRLIFSKGHASPLLYALYAVAGKISFEELITLRQFKSRLEGHPTPRFPFADVATGSLGQGLSLGLGMAMGIKLKIKNAKLKIKRVPKVWVLLGDSEMAEGQIWEAMNLASYYQVNNLIAIADVNRLGQRGETIAGWDLSFYEKKARAFGWQTSLIDDGHHLEKINQVFAKITKEEKGPTIVIAKTIKGKGVSFLENQENWHGKALNQEQLKKALEELGRVDLKIRGKIARPMKIDEKNFDQPSIDEKIFTVLTKLQKFQSTDQNNQANSSNQSMPSTREAYGDSLVTLGKKNPHLVVLDAETSNSTFAEKFKKAFPDRFFEMFIAEQNMISVAVGLSKIGFVPFCSTFAAFLTRAFDQIRMAQYSQTDIKICGSHAGVSIGADGPSQMGLEDLAMFRAILNSVIFYPADKISAEKLTKLAFSLNGIIYLRTTRDKTPIIYDEKEEFVIGGFKLHQSPLAKEKKRALIIAAGITLHQALLAQKKLTKDKIACDVLDLYCVKPIDEKKLQDLAKNYTIIVVVEDHYTAGGIGEAVLSALYSNSQSDLKINQLRIENFIHLCVHQIPRSGKPEELLSFEKINAEAIIKIVKTLRQRRIGPWPKV